MSEDQQQGRWCARCRCFHRQKPFDINEATRQGVEALREQIEKDLIENLRNKGKEPQ